jgi:membrane associated rhomboid family serine protease
MLRFGLRSRLKAVLRLVVVAVGRDGDRQARGIVHRGVREAYRGDQKHHRGGTRPAPESIQSHSCQSNTGPGAGEQGSGKEAMGGSVYCRAMLPVSDVIPSRTTPFVTIGLIVANALTFAYQLQLDRPAMYDFARAAGVIPADLALTSIVSGLFVHDGWLQLAANMLYLWIFGENVEDVMGHAGYLGFYLAAGCLAALVHVGFHPASLMPHIGSSGAVAAVLGAYFVMFPGSRVLNVVFLIVYRDVVEVPAIFFLALWFVLQLLAPLASMGVPAADGLGLDGYISGFAIGAALGFLRRRRRWP